MLVLEAFFMFFCSLTVLTFIKLGGIVGIDIRKTVLYKDFLVGLFLSVILLGYFRYRKILMSDNEQSMDDVHIVHLVGNFLLLEMILLNGSAMKYWGNILRRWWNNREVYFRRNQARAAGPPELPCPVNTGTTADASAGRWCAPQEPGRSLGGRGERRHQGIVEVEVINSIISTSIEMIEIIEI